MDQAPMAGHLAIRKRALIELAIWVDHAAIPVWLVGFLAPLAFVDFGLGVL